MRRPRQLQRYSIQYLDENGQSQGRIIEAYCHSIALARFELQEPQAIVLSSINLDTEPKQREMNL